MRQGKGSFSEKAKKFNRGSLSKSSESACFWLQCDPSLISVACSKQVVHYGETLGDQVKGRSPKK